MRFAVGCWLIIFFSVGGVFAQNNSPYPQNAEGIIDFAETMFKTNFSKKEIVKRLGTIKKSEEEDDEFDEYNFAVEPNANGRETIEEIIVFVNDENQWVESVDFRFINPVKISYGTMRKKYGLPKILPSPIVNCGKIANCNRKLFVGYAFEQNRLVGKKKVKISIYLQMKATSQFPKSTDRSILEVESISFRLTTDYL